MLKQGWQYPKKNPCSVSKEGKGEHNIQTFKHYKFKFGCTEYIYTKFQHCIKIGAMKMKFHMNMWTYRRTVVII